MSESDEPADFQDEEFDNNAHQVCYIYKPFTTETIDERPSKKRKTEHAPTASELSLPRLFQGREPDDLASHRHDQLRRVLRQKEKDIEEMMDGIDETVVTRLAHFVASAHKDSRSKDKLPTGFVVSGPDSSIQTRLQKSWRRLQADSSSTILIQLRASACPNLQTTLKNIVKNAMTERVGFEGYAEFLAKHKRLIPMNFDLELLQLFVKERGIEKVIVSVVDVETFDTSVLSQLLWTLSSWCLRVPFVALIGIATTVELFESRLSKSTVTQLVTEVFRVTSQDDLLYKVYETVQYGTETGIIFGPSTISALYEASQSQSTTVETFTNMIKVAYMSFYFANSLSVLASGDNLSKQDTKLLCEAIRNTDSFRQYCKSLLGGNKAERSQLEKLLVNDTDCLKIATKAIASGQASATTALRIIRALKDLHNALGIEKSSSFLVDVDLYKNCEHLASADVFEEIITTLRKLPSDQLLAMIEKLSLSSQEILTLNSFVTQVRDLQSANSNKAIQPGSDSSTLMGVSTPVKKGSQSIKSSKKLNASASTISVSSEYAALISSLVGSLTSIVESHAFSFDIFMHEAYVINSRQPLLAAFTPRPRHVLERALSKPADYLGCSCGDDSKDSYTNTIDEEDDNFQSSHSLPPASIVYDLLQEAGTIINVRDLFDAFQSRLNPSSAANKSHHNGTTENNIGEDIDDIDAADDNDKSDDEIEMEEGDAKKKQQRVALGLFYRSLAELKMLGMVKSSTSTMTKKRALASETGGMATGKGKKAYAEIDFIAKTSWAGL